METVKSEKVLSSNMRRQNRKWTEKEVKMILNYMRETPDIEAPTAQIYYRKLLEKTNIDATWILLRWKVRHLKSTFKKANEVRKSNTAGLLKGDAESENIEKKIERICPFYHELNDIFGDMFPEESDYPASDSEEASTMDYSITPDNNEIKQELPIQEVCAYEWREITSPAEETEHIPVDQGTIPIISRHTNEYDLKRKRVPVNSSSLSPSAHLASFQKDRTDIFSMKIEWEKEKFEREFMLNERKLSLEEEKIRAEIEYKKKTLELRILEIEKDEKLKVFQIEKDTKLKILEMEKDERLKKYEMHMKYNHE